MAQCNIQAYHTAVSPDHSIPFSGAGGAGGYEARAHRKCITHNFDMSEASTSHQEQCPIGQIEEATEKGLKEISEALSFQLLS